MPAIAVDEIAALLAATDIAELELSGPGGHLVLRRAPDGRIDSVAPDPSPAPAALVTVPAPGVGRFRTRHPLGEVPLAPLGARVAAGAVLGLLQVDVLLFPVLSPKAGVLVSVLASDATLVGYGTPLFQLNPDIE